MIFYNEAAEECCTVQEVMEKKTMMVAASFLSGLLFGSTSQEGELSFRGLFTLERLGLLIVRSYIMSSVYFRLDDSLDNNT